MFSDISINVSFSYITEQGQPWAIWTNCSILGPVPGCSPAIDELDDKTLSISVMALVTGC